jgi:hypothetical protein
VEGDNVFVAENEVIMKRGALFIKTQKNRIFI